MLDIIEKYKRCISREKANWEMLHMSLRKEFGGNSTLIDKAMDEIVAYRRTLGYYDCPPPIV